MRLALATGMLSALLASLFGLCCGHQTPVYAPSVKGGASDFEVRYGDIEMVIQAPSGYLVVEDGGVPTSAPAGFIVSAGESYVLGLLYGEMNVYMLVKVYTTTDFTDSSKVTLSVDEDMVKKVLSGDSQILRINDPQVKVTVLEARIGNRAPQGFEIGTSGGSDGGFGDDDDGE